MSWCILVLGWAVIANANNYGVVWYVGKWGSIRVTPLDPKPGEDGKLASDLYAHEDTLKTSRVFPLKLGDCVEYEIKTDDKYFMNTLNSIKMAPGKCPVTTTIPPTKVTEATTNEEPQHVTTHMSVTAMPNEGVTDGLSLGEKLALAAEMINKKNAGAGQ